MSLDALTTAAILSGGFVLATATAHTPKRSAHRRASSPLLAQEARQRRRAIHARRRERTPFAWRRSRPLR
jgi:hypothetical protein